MKSKNLFFATVVSVVLCLCVLSGCSDGIPEKPEDTALEFWIAQDVSDVDFSGHYAVRGGFGAQQYYGRDYYPVIFDENGWGVEPQYCVTYTVGAYPDQSDGGSFVTRITITDPSVTVYGISCTSSLDEFDQTFRQLGYTVTAEGVNTHQAKTGKVAFRLYSSEVGSQLNITVDVTNKRGINY